MKSRVESPYWKKGTLLSLSLALVAGTSLFLTACSESQDAPKRHVAFEGAPPVIPHSSYGGGSMSCLMCHLNGRDNAPITPHQERQVCTQCHVGQETQDKEAVWKENTFEPK